MIAYLLDTNVISEVRKPRPHVAVLKWVASLTPRQIHIPAVALFELQAGVELTRRQDKEKALEIENWIDSLSQMDNIVPMDGDCFRLCAKMMDGKAEQLFADAMISAMASIHRLTVATRNIGDYQHFEVPILNPFSNRH